MKQPYTVVTKNSIRLATPRGYVAPPDEFDRLLAVVNEGEHLTRYRTRLEASQRWEAALEMVGAKREKQNNRNGDSDEPQ